MTREELKGLRAVRKSLSCELAQWNLFAVVHRCEELNIEHGVDLFRANYIEVERSIGYKLRGLIVDTLHPLPKGVGRVSTDFVY